MIVKMIALLRKYSGLAKRYLIWMLSRSLSNRPGSAVLSSVRLCDFGGVKIRLDLSEQPHRRIYLDGSFEPELTAILYKICRPGDVFIDIGANVGWHSLFLLVKRPDVRMSYAFEPSKRAFALLMDSIAANSLQDRCIATRIALADRQGETTLKSFNEFGTMHSSLYSLADWPYEEEVVQIRTLDSVAETFVSPASVIKCDVEGGERDVLLGAPGVLSGKSGPPPIWFLEANYETSGMAGYFPWQLAEIATQYAPYESYFIRHGQILSLPHRNALRHGDILVLAIPDLHKEQLRLASL